MSNVYDLIIIGGGPAGLTASIYAARAGISYALIDKGFPGGQIMNTSEVDNYPGLPSIGGMDLAMKMVDHAQQMGMNSLAEEVTGLELGGEEKTVRTIAGEYKAKHVLLCMGASPNLLGAPGEKELRGRGVSYCATCDGAFFRKKTVAVVGGGDTALQDALYLSGLCEKVYMIVRRNVFRGANYLQERVKAKENIEVLFGTTVSSIEGLERVRALVINTSAGIRELAVDGVFIAVGITPNSQLVKGMVDTTSAGYVITDKHCLTSIPGIYAAGDVRDTPLRQIITAAADAAVAVQHMLEA